MSKQEEMIRVDKQFMPAHLRDVEAASSGEAQDYFYGAVEQLDLLAIGEDDAKVMLALASIAAANTLLMGDPGGSKSVLSNNYWRLFTDVDWDKNVAIIPADAELSSTRVGGGDHISTEFVTVDGAAQEERKSVYNLDGLLTPDTMIIQADEVNRTNPTGKNPLLGALQERAIRTTKGLMLLPKLRSANSTMNVRENPKGVFPMLLAESARYPLGVYLGENPEDDEKIARGIMLRGFEPQPDKMEALIDEYGIRRIQRLAYNLPIKHSLGDRVVKLALDTRTTLREEGVSETQGRIAKQIIGGARALSALYGESDVTPEALNDTVHFMVTSRLGSLMARSAVEIKKIVDDISIAA